MVDLEKLLTPISEESPTGVNLRDQPADLTFQQLEEERTEVRPEDDPTGAGRLPNWEKVAARSEGALSTTSKDLQLAVWLAEALARNEGLRGLQTGLRLVTELLGKFWDRIHPGFDPETEVVLPVRARPLSWLGSSRDFLRSAASCPIVPRAEGQRALSWDDYRNASLVDEKRVLVDQSQYEGLRALGFIDGEEWNARLGALPASALRETLGDVIGCQEALAELRALADKQFGSDEGPDFVALAELLLELHDYLEERIPAEPEGAALQKSSEAGSPSGAAASSGPIASREEALRRLSEVAEFFRRTEPHSPISYLVERGVRWGHLPLMEVLREFIEDPNSLARIQHNLGIRGESTGS